MKTEYEIRIVYIEVARKLGLPINEDTYGAFHHGYTLGVAKQKHGLKIPDDLPAMIKKGE